jgi:hypothetical protein
MIPAPQVTLRLLVLFRGVPDAEMKEWTARKVGTETGVDWREA